MTLKNSLPIRKLAVGAVAWGVYYAAQKAHLPTITHDVSNQVGQGVVTFAASYLIPDPRVQKLVTSTRVTLVAKLKALNALLTAAATPQPEPPKPLVPVPPVPPVA